MWSWDSIVSAFHIAVDVVQDVSFPCWKAYMLMLKNSSEVAVLKIPRSDEYSVCLFGLVFADGVMQLA